MLSRGDCSQTSTADIPRLPVVIVGAGPVGLAAAAHLVARGIEPLVLEVGDQVAAAVQDWGHVRLFSPWRYNIDKAAARLLEASGWQAPNPESLPTGRELYERYLMPLAATPSLRDRLRLGRKVVAITRHGMDKVRTSHRAEAAFVVRAATASGALEEYMASAVIDATGTWWSPNPLGASGIPAHGELASRERIHYGIPDVLGVHKGRYAGKTTLVVGAGHSAANSILALAELAKTASGTAIHWATRGGNLARVFGGGEGDGLPARGQLGSDLQALIESGKLVAHPNFRIEGMREADAQLEVHGIRDTERVTISGIDAIIAATGQRPDLAMTRELRLALDPALECAAQLAPLIDPNEHSCGTVRPHGAGELAHPEPNFFTIGSKSYGRAPTFLLATGHEQARSVAALIAGDHAAAMRVELELPETGVCHSNLVTESAKSAKSGGCCPPTRKGCC